MHRCIGLAPRVDRHAESVMIRVLRRRQLCLPRRERPAVTSHESHLVFVGPLAQRLMPGLWRVRRCPATRRGRFSPEGHGSLSTTQETKPGDLPMDRLSRRLAGCGLATALLLLSAGCRSMRSEVPRGRPFSADGKQPPSIGFSSEPNQVKGFSGLQTAPGTRNNVGQFGLPSPGPNTSNYGVPAGSYGPPGTAMLGTTPSGGANPATGIPQNGTGPAGASSGAATQPGGMPPSSP
jgi:hypothetical protein